MYIRNYSLELHIPGTRDISTGDKDLSPALPVDHLEHWWNQESKSPGSIRRANTGIITGSDF